MRDWMDPDHPWVRSTGRLLLKVVVGVSLIGAGDWALDWAAGHVDLPFFVAAFAVLYHIDRVMDAVYGGVEHARESDTESVAFAMLLFSVSGVWFGAMAAGGWLYGVPGVFAGFAFGGIVVAWLLAEVATRGD